MRHILGRRQIVDIIIGVSYKAQVVRIVKYTEIHFRIYLKGIYYVSPILQSASVVNSAKIASTNGTTQLPPD